MLNNVKHERAELHNTKKIEEVTNLEVAVAPPLAEPAPLAAPIVAALNSVRVSIRNLLVGDSEKKKDVNEKEDEEKNEEKEEKE
jgi:hypothetical protein